jgi:acid phosphatase
MKNVKIPISCALIIFFSVISFSCKKDSQQMSDLQSPDLSQSAMLAVSLPHPDHIIFVWFENKAYSNIIGSSSAPYINSLRAKGTLFSSAYAITHPSYPNYVDFFSGQNNGVTNDDCINSTTRTTANLYTQLKTKGKTFAWYSEGLPSTGSTVCSYGYYREKHNPVTIFSNVPATQNKRFADFPTDYAKLENVVCITPNMIDDMHDGTIAQGDTWLKNKLSALATWCITHNSIFVVYFDEDNGVHNNHIPVIAVGQHVMANRQLSTRYDHYNWTRTICSMFYAPNTWTSNLSSRSDITGCWY